MGGGAQKRKRRGERDGGLRETGMEGLWYRATGHGKRLEDEMEIRRNKQREEG